MALSKIRYFLNEIWMLRFCCGHLHKNICRCLRNIGGHFYGICIWKFFFAHNVNLHVLKVQTSGKEEKFSYSDFTINQYGFIWYFPKSWKKFTTLDVSKPQLRLLYFTRSFHCSNFTRNVFSNPMRDVIRNS